MSGASVHTDIGERFVLFRCHGDACIGVLAAPHQPASARLAIVVVVGGPQYRVGAHRQFVALSRSLAQARWPTLRFDYRGMGDSEGDFRSFECIADDIGAAVDTARSETGAERIVLWGLCDGASAALMYAADDDRIAGIVAVNPWARSPQGHAVTQLRHHYAQRLVSVAFWKKLATGGVDLFRAASELRSTVGGALRSQPPAPDYLQRMHDGWLRLQRPMLLLLSGRDNTAREFEAWAAADPGRTAAMRRGDCAVVKLPEADHTFTERPWCDEASRRTVEWIAQLSARY